MSSRAATPVRFMQLMDAMYQMEDDEYNELSEDAGGQLGLVREYWEECKALPDTLEYDPCDAGYIMQGLRDLDQLHCTHKVPAERLPQFWQLALDAAVALMEIVDFNCDHFGVFCYEELGTNEGELVYRLYYEAIQHPGDVRAIIRDFAVSEDWPLLDASA